MRIDSVDVYGIHKSIKASKYPMSVDVSECSGEITTKTKALGGAERGSGHDQFLTGIIAQFDLTFSVKAWVEAERYHFLDFVSSQSTMHRITALDPDVQCNEYVDERNVALLREKSRNTTRTKLPKTISKCYTMCQRVMNLQQG